MNSSNELIVA